MNLRDEKTIREVENSIGFALPVQYREFMLYSNGAEGELGENSYLVIWPIEDIISLNEAYDVSRYTPGILYFGSDGGDAAYALDARDEAKSIIEMPFESIHKPWVIIDAAIYDITLERAIAVTQEDYSILIRVKEEIGFNNIFS